MARESNELVRRMQTYEHVGMIFLLGIVFGCIIGTVRCVVDSSASGTALLLLVGVVGYLLNLYIYITFYAKQYARTNGFLSIFKFAALVLTLLFVPQLAVSIILYSGFGMLRILGHCIAAIFSSIAFMLLTPKFLYLAYRKEDLPSAGILRRQRKKIDILYYSIVIVLTMLLLIVSSSVNAIRYSEFCPFLPIFLQEFSILACCTACSYKLLSTYNKL